MPPAPTANDATVPTSGGRDVVVCWMVVVVVVGCAVVDVVGGAGVEVEVVVAVGLTAVVVGSGVGTGRRVATRGDDQNEGE